MRLRSRFVLPKLAPLPQITFGRSEQCLRVQEAPTRIAPVLLIIVHVATPAGSHALHDLFVRHAGLTIGNCGHFLHHRLSESVC